MLLKNFYEYQRTRFPVILLIISLIPVALSSAAVTIGNPSALQILGVLIVSILYLLHIRITDEIRDLNHDNRHHQLRPIQSGTISIRELKIIDVFCVIFIIVVTLLNNTYSSSLALLMLLYTYFAGKEFFIKDKLHKHFFIYNSINIIQMFLLQSFVYTFFTGLIKFSPIIISHFFFTLTGTIIYEFIRKVKNPGEDGTGKDTYTYYLGFYKAIIIFLFLVLLNISSFYFLAKLIAESSNYLSVLSIFFFLTVLLFTVIRVAKQSSILEQLMQLSFVIVYAILNIVIFIVS